jgi:hypothetical protein
MGRRLFAEPAQLPQLSDQAAELLESVGPGVFHGS